MEKRVANRQSTPAFRVHFRPRLASSPQLEGTGVLRDLSVFGCRIESSVTMIPDLSLTLRIEVPGLDSPLIIEGARVQWVSGQVFGLGAFRTTETERQRLGQVIMSLMGR